MVGGGVTGNTPSFGVGIQGSIPCPPATSIRRPVGPWSAEADGARRKSAMDGVALGDLRCTTCGPSSFFLGAAARSGKAGILAAEDPPWPAPILTQEQVP